MSLRLPSLLAISTSLAVGLVFGQGCSSDDPAPASADLDAEPNDGTVPVEDAGPDGDGVPTIPASFTDLAGILEAKVTIPAATGGRVELPGGAAFEVPAGALEEDTEVTLRVPADQTDASNIQKFHFEPTGLTFSKPAILRVSYGGIQEEEPTVRAWASGDFHPLRGVGSELTDREPMTVLAVDGEAKTLDLEVDHFTFFVVFIKVDQFLYVVPHIPPKYLHPGDMLFVLTGADGEKGPHWHPGHVGIFTGGGQPCSNQAQDGVIESTPVSKAAIEAAEARRENARRQGKPLPPLPQSGVSRNSLANFKVESGHRYMGARRPGDGSPLSASERASIVQFCEQQLGKSYHVIGQGNINQASWSCVGLAEAAYDEIQRGSMGAVREALAGTPLELFWNTRPVDEITMGVGDLLEMTVEGTVVHPDSFWPGITLIGSNPYPKNVLTSGWYCHETMCGIPPAPAVNITLEGTKPQNAVLVKHGFNKRLVYLGAPEDVGKSYELIFKATADVLASTPIFGTRSMGQHTREARLKLNVVPCPAAEEPPACLDPEDTPEERIACLVAGEDDKAKVSSAVVELPEGGEHPHSNPSLPQRPIVYAGDLVSFFGALMDLTQEEYDAAFGNSHLPCGGGPFGLTLCGTAAASAGSGEWVVVSARMRGDIPIADPNRHYQYAFVFDQDDATTNNYVGTAPFTGDYFSGTDRWYEAVYAPGTGWELKTRNANQLSQVTAFASAARFIVSSDAITLAVPKSEFSSAAPKVRVTAFMHTGDFGIPAPHEYGADTHPRVGQPLHALTVD